MSGEPYDRTIPILAGDVWFRLSELERRVAALEAAGGPTREDGLVEPEATTTTPAADEYTMCRTCGHPYIATTAPAADPLVCEWIQSRIRSDLYETTCTNSIWTCHDHAGICPSCGKPIVFKEPKP